MMNHDPILVDLLFLLFLSMTHQNPMLQFQPSINLASMTMIFLMQTKQVHMIFHVQRKKIPILLRYQITMTFHQHLTKAVLPYMMEELSAALVAIHLAVLLFDLHQEVIPASKLSHYPVLEVDLIAPVWNNILVIYMTYLLNLNRF